MANEIWQNIINHAGENFHTILGHEFQYEVHQNRIQIVGNAPYHITLNNIANALALGPVNGPGAYPENIVGPSYVWALLHDARINVW